MLHEASHQVSAQEDIWFGRCWVKNSKMAVSWIYILYVNGVILAILSLYVAGGITPSIC